MSRNLYEEVTAKILADMEAGIMPWEKSWDGSKRGSFGIPTNAVTGRPYRGVNVLLLWGASMRFDMNDMRFLTFKQALDAGGSVRKGEHGSKIVFYKPLAIKDKITEEDKTIPMLREFTVFHVSQTDGCKFAEISNEAPVIPSDTAELVSAIAVKVKHGGDRACYIPSADQVLMPYAQDFKSEDAYRATLYHEITHWTGAKHRLDRNLRNSFGSTDYAYEELVAELGGAFICAEFGLPYQTQHASYLASWIKKLQDDKRMILKASSAAQKAVDYIKSLVTAEPMALEMAA